MFKIISVQLMFGLSLLFPSIANSQDIQFSQFYSNVLYLNPAFAGNAHAARGILHQRLQWPALDAKYITSFISVDNFFSKTNSGVGMYFLKDWQGTNTISSSEVALQYSYELNFSPTHSFRGGLQASYVSRFINYSYLKFPDQYNDWGYLGSNTSQPFGTDKVEYLDFTSGGIVYSNKYWVGFTYAHINQPNQSFLGVESILPSKFDLTGGYRIDFESKLEHKLGDHGRDVYLTPTFHYKMQGKSDQVDLGVYFLYDRIITGFWYRGIPIFKHYRREIQNNESFVVQIGYRVKGISVCYSYDGTVSKLTPARTGGSHEVNITYVYEKPPKKIKKLRKIPCPDFRP